jgi:hypothetical protein
MLLRNSGTHLLYYSTTFRAVRTSNLMLAPTTPEQWSASVVLKVLSVNPYRLFLSSDCKLEGENIALNILQTLFMWNNGITNILDSKLRRESVLVT